MPFWKSRRLETRIGLGLAAGSGLADWSVVNIIGEAVIDLAAIRENTAALRERVGTAGLMAVVKADGYGHGMIPAANAALAGGASWLAVVGVPEALALRGAGITAPVLCLMDDPQAAHAEAIGRGIDLCVGTRGTLSQIAAAARSAGRPARIHLKADTGMSRGGATVADWPGLVDAALAAQADGYVEITAIWSHLACADIPGHVSVEAQLAAFGDAVERAEKAGARPELRHLANTAATLTRPDAWFDLVRAGGGIYGLGTMPGGPPGWLRPAMTARTRLVQVKRVPAGLGRVVRAPLRHEDGDHARAGAGGLCGGRAQDGVGGGAGSRRRAAPGDLRHGLHEPVRGRPRR